MQQLELSWQRVWSALRAAPAPGLFDRLLASYCEAHRRYHTLQHLRECLAALEPMLMQAEHPGEAEVALWFHDAAYDPRRQDNEHQSALWAGRELAAAGLPAGVQERVFSLVMATRHAAHPATRDECLVVDADLCILGASPQRFAEYEAQVRAEYAWVPQLQFLRARKAILQGFLAHPAIYATAYCRQRHEAQARRNLAQAVRELARAGGDNISGASTDSGDDPGHLRGGK